MLVNKVTLVTDPCRQRGMMGAHASCEQGRPGELESLSVTLEHVGHQAVPVVCVGASPNLAPVNTKASCVTLVNAKVPPGRTLVSTEVS